MKLDLVRSNRNPVHVSVFESTPLVLDEWNVINIASLPMPIHIRRITFFIETDIDGSFAFLVRLTRGNEKIFLAGSSMLSFVESIGTNFWINLVQTPWADDALTIPLPMKVSFLPDLGLSDFDSIDVYPKSAGATPTRVTMYLGWSYQ
jgi:hypothetical protein